MIENLESIINHATIVKSLLTKVILSQCNGIDKYLCCSSRHRIRVTGMTANPQRQIGTNIRLIMYIILPLDVARFIIDMLVKRSQHVRVSSLTCQSSLSFCAEHIYFLPATRGMAITGKFSRKTPRS